MWRHACPIERTSFEIGAGEACSWCGQYERERPPALQLVVSQACPHSSAWIPLLSNQLPSVPNQLARENLHAEEFACALPKVWWNRVDPDRAAVVGAAGAELASLRVRLRKEVSGAVPEARLSCAAPSG
jgi:hypothetical protein